MKRREWTFPHTAAKLAEAAKVKLQSHQTRLEWWEKKKKEVMDKIRESGIEVYDSVASTYSNTKGLAGPEIRIDSTLQRDLTETQMKIQEHADYVKSYTSWIEVFEGNPEARLDLDHDDYLYFFGK